MQSAVVCILSTPQRHPTTESASFLCVLRPITATSLHCHPVSSCRSLSHLLSPACRALPQHRFVSFCTFSPRFQLIARSLRRASIFRVSKYRKALVVQCRCTVASRSSQPALSPLSFPPHLSSPFLFALACQDLKDVQFLSPNRPKNSTSLGACSFCFVLLYLFPSPVVPLQPCLTFCRPSVDSTDSIHCSKTSKHRGTPRLCPPPPCTPVSRLTFSVFSGAFLSSCPCPDATLGDHRCSLLHLP